MTAEIFYIPGIYLYVGLVKFRNLLTYSDIFACGRDTTLKLRNVM